MSVVEMALEAVLVTAAKGLVVFCLCAMAVIVAGALCGRGMESVWPDEGREPQPADVPSSSDL